MAASCTAGVAAQFALHLIECDALAADFHLTVGTAGKFHNPIGPKGVRDPRYGRARAHPVPGETNGP